jgi:hypothetical protein
MAEADSYVAKWIAAAPERELALQFVPAPQRRLAALWCALCHELDETVFDLSDAGVAKIKLAWWGEELTHAAQGEARHPLVHELFQHAPVRDLAAVRWAEWARNGLGALLDESTPADTAAMLARHHSYAGATARIEADLLGGEPAAEAVAIAQCLRLWPAEKPSSWLRWPMHLRARHQIGTDAVAPPGLLRDLAAELIAMIAVPSGASPVRRGLAALDRFRLQALRRHGSRVEIGRWRALWLCWRAARGR